MVARGGFRLRRHRLRLGGYLGVSVSYFVNKELKFRCQILDLSSYIPPPKGVYGCGASTIARPGV